MKLSDLSMIATGLVVSSMVAMPSNSNVDGWNNAQTENNASITNATPINLPSMTVLLEPSHARDQDFLGQTALIRAAESGRADLVEELIQRGAEVNVRDQWGRTALAAAIHNDHRGIVTMLIKHGADISL
ncbi:MAG: ankyrin repeat domain-containing protein [Magnetococcales bacterium]|nr:ankyrin repeat domain-containing protein [Magnetococcales bacterium]